MATSLALNIQVGAAGENGPSNDIKAVQRYLSSNSSTGEASSRKNDTAAYFITCQDLRLSLLVASEEQNAVNGDSPSRYIPEASTSPSQPRFAAIFVPSTLVQAAVGEVGDVELTDKVYPPTASNHLPATQIISLSASEQARLSPSLLNKIHPVFATGAEDPPLLSMLVSLVNDNEQQHCPSDVILLDLRNWKSAQVSELLYETSGQTLVDNNAAPLGLKVVLLSRVDIASYAGSAGSATTPSSAILPTSTLMDVPHCPVCLHRIDPLQLGLPRPRNQELCSKFCPVPTDQNGEAACPRQQLLRPWPQPPSHCQACHVIQSYWKRKNKSNQLTAASAEKEQDDLDERHDLFCCECAMQETLWVCLVCGFVGCGRYSNKHAAEHFATTRHVHSLELATLRIWNYVTGQFVHRVDLLECPSSPPRLLQHLQPWLQQQHRAGHTPFPLAPGSPQEREDSRSGVEYWQSASASPPGQLFAAGDALLAPTSSSNLRIPSMFPTTEEKSPKKATMIGEEYEALLHSALEEQTQHYEGEIIRLRAELTAQNLDEDKMTKEEAEEVECIREQVASLRTEIERCSRDLVDLQSQEAASRSTSQCLLREQQVSEDLFKKIQEEAANEHAQGRMQMDELEQQIADLTANQRMRREFVNNNELLNAQIFGTTSSSGAEAQKSSNKKNKKGRRFFRK